MRTTHLLIALNCLIYAAMLAINGGEWRAFSGRTLLEFGALYPPLVREGEWWRMATMLFMHITPIHLALNMMALYECGAVLEPQFGRLRFVGLYLLAGIAGSALSLAWNWRHPGGPSAGASGAIAGLIGAGAVVGHHLGGVHGRRFRDFMLLWAAVVLGFGVWVRADNAAHAGGFVVGVAAAWWMSRRAPARPTRLGWDAVILLVIVGVGFTLAARHRAAKTAEEWIDEGVAEAKAGRQAVAIDDYRRALALEPENVVARYDLALALLTARDFAAAEHEARRATETDASHRDSWGALAQALEAMGRDPTAAYARYEQLGGHIDGGTD